MAMTATDFRLPQDWSIFSEHIFGRCRDLISYGVWSGVPLPRLDAWIANFRTEREKYFAACILDRLIYRSGLQTESLMRQLFQRILPDLRREPRCSVTALSSPYERLQLEASDGDPLIRLVPIVPPDGSPAKSGPTIARLLRRNLRFNDFWIIWPDRIPAEIGSGVEAIVFIDDFLGSGDQFSEFVHTSGLSSQLSAACMIYAPLAGHVIGVDRLRTEFPDLTIEVVERLTDENAVFHDASGYFDDGTNSPDAAREFYYELLDKYHIHIAGPTRRGYGHFELAYAFEHAVPDNSLPILWWAHSPNWQPLFFR